MAANFGRATPAAAVAVPLTEPMTEPLTEPLTEPWTELPSTLAAIRAPFEEPLKGMQETSNPFANEAVLLVEPGWPMVAPPVVEPPDVGGGLGRPESGSAGTTACSKSETGGRLSVGEAVGAAEAAGASEREWL